MVLNKVIPIGENHTATTVKSIYVFYIFDNSNFYLAQVHFVN